MQILMNNSPNTESATVHVSAISVSRNQVKCLLRQCPFYPASGVVIFIWWRCFFWEWESPWYTCITKLKATTDRQSGKLGSAHKRFTIQFLAHLATAS